MNLCSRINFRMWEKEPQQKDSRDYEPMVTVGNFKQVVTTLRYNKFNSLTIKIRLKVGKLVRFQASSSE